MEISTIFSTGLDLFAGGIIIAINIAYSAIPIALLIASGKTEPMTEPSAVPSVQPMIGPDTRPNI